MPTNLGGLGVGSIEDTAKSVIQGQVWNIASCKREVIWVNWIHTKYIKDKVFFKFASWNLHANRGASKG